ncbi:MAG: hypothetical protein IJV40_11945 [Oscillospiraceae bacterium]|nr:hypothetical protein [Oscillospiraceae bacterium]
MKKFLTYVSLAVILFAGFTAAIRMSVMPRTYEGQNATVPVAVLQQSPDSYDDSTADGAAAVIVQQNLAESHAVNDVTSIVFDFRGYDTMGEAFILITAVAGSTVILFTKKAGKEETKDEE